MGGTGDAVRLGFVGVGRHGQKMAAVFRECGAEIVAFDRGTGDPRDLVRDPLFGSRMPWRSQVLAPGVDAIVCCAPPDVTQQVQRAIEHSAKRAVLTKPVDWPDDVSCRGYESSVYIDLWRLYSPAWLALKADLQGREIRSVHVDFYGNGPVRATHSGLLDYGCHALAFVLDLGLRPELSWANQTGPGVPATRWMAHDHAQKISATTGNGFDRQAMSVTAWLSDDSALTWDETEGVHTYRRSGVSALQCDRSLALRNFCRAFLSGEPSDTLRISCESMRLLRQAEPW